MLNPVITLEERKTEYFSDLLHVPHYLRNGETWTDQETNLTVNIRNIQSTSSVEVVPSSLHLNKLCNNLSTTNLLWPEENLTGHTKTNQKALHVCSLLIYPIL